MKQITVEQLHAETERWVEEAADNGGIVVMKDGKPIATISQVEPSAKSEPLPGRETEIQKRTRFSVGSGVRGEELEHVRKEAIAAMKRGLHLGGKPLSRGEIYERRPFR